MFLTRIFQDATVVFLATQASTIIYFFLARNLRIARTRAWEQTVASRRKGTDFFQPYVEEWDNPPVVDEDRWAALAVVRGRVMSLFLKRSASSECHSSARSPADGPR